MFMLLWREAKQTGEGVCLEKWLNKCTKKQKAAACNAMVNCFHHNEINQERTDIAV
jgi:hypothetical protein